MEYSSSIVIKVKHGDTLRRFNAQIVDKKLDLSMAKLKEKICSLFDFVPDADITLTYIDEDSDVVTLVNDDDLHDAVQQALNPMRITVKLNSDKKYDDTNEKTTRDLRDNVSESLGNVPEPLRGMLSQISNDLVSKASPFAPGTISDLVDYFSNTPSKLSGLGVEGVLKIVSDVISEISSKNNVNFQDVIGANTAGSSGTANVVTGNDNPPLQPNSGADKVGDSAKPSNVSSFGIAIGKEADEPTVPISGSFPFGTLPPIPEMFSGSSGSPFGCPFSGIPLHEGSSAPPVPAWRNGFGSNGKTIHRGIRCDCCGVYPITGPRYKSNVKYDYDLCSTCFSKEGNDADYTRLEGIVHLPRMPFKFHDAHHRDRSAIHHRFHKGCKSKHGATKLDSRFIVDVNIFDGTIIPPLTQFTKIWRMRNNGSLAWPPMTQLIWMGGDKLSNALTVEVEIPSTGLPVDHELDVAVDFISPELPGRYVSYWRMATPTGQKFGQRVWVLIQVDNSVNESPNGSIRNLNLNLPPLNPINSSTLQIVPDKSGNKQETPEHDLPKKMMDFSEPVIDSNPNVDQELKFPINNTLLIGEGSSSPSAPYPVIDYTEINDKVPEKEEKLLKELDEMGFEQIDLNKEILRIKEYDMEQTVDELCGFSEWDHLLEELKEMGFEDKEVNKKLLEKNNGSIQRVVMDLVAAERA